MDADASDEQSWELATESIVVKIRWFGIVMGYVLVQTRVGLLHNPSAVRAFLALGAGYAALDTAFHRMGEVFLKRWPLFVSLMEGLFIALLCYHDTGLDSPFRWYYLLSALCCAIRYRPAVAWTTFALHAASLLALAAVLPPSSRQADPAGLPMTLVLLAWATWASASLASLLKATGARLERANAALAGHQAELEQRVAEAQARVIHQEKMAAFGMMAAGIAHEVGNPLAALSSLVQVLRRRDPDPYTAEKLDLAAAQLGRIGRTLRELVDFSRPAARVAGAVRLADAVDEALGIAKYHHRTKERAMTTSIPPDLPAIHAVRDHLTQVILNLVLNAIDATAKGGHVHIEARADGDRVELSVADDGRGINLADRCRLFQPYFTTKPRGTGLGLFLSRQIVEELGGTLTYRTALGRGTTFTVRLPAMPPAPVAVAAAAEGVAG
jgi:two-component system, NtrC family, sensor kinase